MTNEVEIATSWSVHAGRFLASLLLAPLPARWRAWAHERVALDCDQAAIPSGLVQLALGMALWALAYFAWFHGLSAAIDEAANRMGDSGKYDAESYKMIGAAALWMSPLLPVVFMVTTLKGFLCTVTALDGLVRTINAAATGTNVPDPALSLVDWGAFQLQKRLRSKRRELAKGPVTPDSILLGVRAENGFDLRLVTATDFGWRPGNTVFVSGEPLILMSSEEIRDSGDRLRTRHDFRRLGVGEIIRAPKHYTPTQPPQVSTATSAAAGSSSAR